MTDPLAAQSGELYRWVDQDGNVHFTDTPPESSICREEVRSVRTPEPMALRKPSITIYGRDACGITRQMISVLTQEGIPYTYEIIDKKTVSGPLEKRMRAAGIETKRYNLPVVDLAGRLLIRPDPAEVLRLYNQ